MRVSSLLSCKLFGTTGAIIANRMPLTPEADLADMRWFDDTDGFFWKAVLDSEIVRSPDKTGKLVIDSGLSLKKAGITLVDLLNLEDPEIFKAENDSCENNKAIGLWLTLVFLCLGAGEEFPADQIKKTALLFRGWFRLCPVSRIHLQCWEAIFSAIFKSKLDLNELELIGLSSIGVKTNELHVNRRKSFCGGY